MTYSQKIDLENGIFARAGRMGACVEARAGELLCADPDVCLQVMISVYNAFFAKENRALCGDEGEEWACFWRAFWRREIRGGLNGAVYPPDVWAEIRWLGRPRRTGALQAGASPAGHDGCTLLID